MPTKSGFGAVQAVCTETVSSMSSASAKALSASAAAASALAALAVARRTCMLTTEPLEDLLRPASEVTSTTVGFAIIMADDSGLEEMLGKVGVAPELIGTLTGSSCESGVQTNLLTCARVTGGLTCFAELRANLFAP